MHDFTKPLYCEIRDTADRDYFLNSIRSAKGRALEVGVGAGRFFKTALLEGADIYGIDTSPHMLSVLRDKIAPEDDYRISLQSVVDSRSHVKFNLIIAPFHGMIHVLETENQIKILK